MANQPESRQAGLDEEICRGAAARLKSVRFCPKRIRMFSHFSLALALMQASPQPPFGDELPLSRLGTYTNDVMARGCARPSDGNVVIRKQAITLHGEVLPLLLIEKLSDRDFQIFVKVEGSAEIAQYHLVWPQGDDGNLVIIVDAEQAKAIARYGKPVADAGIIGSYMHCPSNGS